MSARIIGSIAALVVLSAHVARASTEEERLTCERSFESGQGLRRDHKLVEARAALLVCAHDPCDPVLEKQCQEWLADIESRSASIVVSIRDALGADVTRGAVTIDGHAGALDGTAVDLDPGEHHVQITVGVTTREQVILLTEGEKRRAVVFHLEPVSPERPPVVPIRPSTPWAAIGVGVVAGVATAVTIALGIEALSQRSAQCPSGNCPSDPVKSSVEGWYVATDVLLGVAVVSGVVSLVLFVTHPHAATVQTAFSF